MHNPSSPSRLPFPKKSSRGILDHRILQHSHNHLRQPESHNLRLVFSWRWEDSNPHIFCYSFSHQLSSVSNFTTGAIEIIIIEGIAYATLHYPISPLLATSPFFQ